MTFEEVLTQAIAMLQRLGRVSDRALKRQFALDDGAGADGASEGGAQRGSQHVIRLTVTRKDHQWASATRARPVRRPRSGRV